MQKRQIWDRVFLCGLIAMVVLSALFDHGDVTFHLIRQAGVSAYFSMAVLSWLTAAAFTDVVINDILPDRYSVRISLYCRQLIWMLIGVTLMGFTYVLLRKGGGWASIWYTLIALRCVSVAFLDLHYELKGRLGSQNA